MKGARAALRYARAILNLAKDSGLEKEVNKDMEFISGTISGSEDLERMLKSPVIKSAEKNKALHALFGEKVNAITRFI